MRTKAVVCLITALSFALQSEGSQASNLFKQGQKAEKNGEMAKAYLLYSEAAAMAPKNNAYWLKSQAVRTRAALQSKSSLPASAADSLEPDPEPQAPEITGQDMREARRPLPPVELAADPARKNLNLKSPPRILFDQVARIYGLDVVFDGDYPPTAPPISFQMDDADYREALRALQAATASFVVPITNKVFLVAKDTQQKRNDVEPAVSVVINIPQAISAQETQELARSVQQVMDLRNFAIDTAHKIVLLRGPISKVRPAQRLFEDLLTYRPEVSVDLQFIEVTRSELTTLGLQLPSEFSFASMTDIFHNVPNLQTGVNYLLFGGGASVFGIGLADVQVLAKFNKGNAHTLLDTSVRSLDGMPATFHVGDRFPVLTSGYFGPPASSQGGTVYTPPPSFNFEDLGISVKLTPRVHGIDEVSLDIEAEFKVLGSESFNGVPVISSRKLVSKVRLRDNESAIVAGMMNSSEARSISGLAGLSQIPGLGALIRRNEKSHDSSEVIIVLRPRLLSLPADESVTRSVWVGTETRPLAPL